MHTELVERALTTAAATRGSLTGAIFQVSDRRYLSEASMTALAAIPIKNTALPATALTAAS